MAATSQQAATGNYNKHWYQYSPNLDFRFQDRIEPLELDPGLLGGKLPVDGDLLFAKRDGDMFAHAPSIPED